MFLIYAVAVVAAIVMTVFLIEKLPAALHDMKEDTKALLTSEKKLTKYRNYLPVFIGNVCR